MSRTRRFLITLFAAYAVIWTGLAVTKYVNRRAALAEANAWHALAQSDSTPDMTVDDAIRWLKEHEGSNIARGEKAWHNDVEVPNRTVIGSRTMSPRTLWSDPLSAGLIFEFDENWRFVGVKLKTQNYLMPESS